MNSEEKGRGQHFTIVVNGRKKEVNQHELTFIEVVRLAFDNPTIDQSTIYTVTYSRGPDHKPEGTMVDGDTVKVKPGMIFNVARTDKS